MFKKKIKIKYFDGDIDRVQKISQGDLIDLRCAETVELHKGDFKLIPLGVAMELPRGYEAHVYPRSSTFKNFGILLVNSVGCIDNSYSGDDDQWFFPAYATRDITIAKGQRICQFRIFKNQPSLKFEFVDHLDNANRGGIGSTGIN